MSRRRKRHAPLPLNGMPQAKKREFAFFPPRSDSTMAPETSSDEDAEIARDESAGTGVFGGSHSCAQKKDNESNCREIAWKVPVKTGPPSTLEEGWLCIGAMQLHLEGHSDVAGKLGGAESLHIGWTVGGELFFEARTGSEAVWLKVSSAKASRYRSLQAGVAESLYYLVERQCLVQVCLLDESPQSVTVGVSVAKRLFAALSENPRGAKVVAEHLRKLVKALFPEITWSGQPSISSEKPCLSIAQRIQQLYCEAQLRRHQLCLHGAMGFNPASIPGLTATLRGYQFDAVCWMVEREGRPVSQEEKQGELHPIWVELPNVASTSATPPVACSSTIYFNPYVGRFSLKWEPKPPWPRGGILADEMGLGKTVEILALILSHKWEGREGVGLIIGSDSWKTEEVHDEVVVTGAIQDRGDLHLPMDVGTSGTVQPKAPQTSSSNGGSPVLPPMKVSDLHSSTSLETTMPFSLETSEEGLNPFSSTMTGTVVLPSSGTPRPSTSVTSNMAADLPSSGTPSPSTSNMAADLQSSGTPGPSTSVTSNTKVLKQQPDTISCMCGSLKKFTASLQSSFSTVRCTVCQHLYHTLCSNYKPHKGGVFICISCLLAKPLFARSTLIVVPESIAPQWSEEIIKHTQPGTLRVLNYLGVSEEYVSPQELASYDIVLATYESLRKELYHSNSHEFSLILRHKKRYALPPSPLPAIHWWRVCLDEAQMVESTHTAAAEMMQRVQATNRWCVTGTPVQHDLSDMHGLFLFLGAEPYCQIEWFNHLIWYPYCHGDREPAVTLLSNLMWRNSKKDVAEELQIPEQTEKVHWLSFGALEAYFYGREQEMCAMEASRVLGCLPSETLSLSNLLHSTVVKIMTPLHRLRKACCHPQMVRGGYLLGGGKGSLTMPQLLKKLIVQAKQEGREALRQLVCALNGLAAMHIIKNEYGEAIGRYREAMSCWKEHEGHLECDKLQRIHTMENLVELLQAGHTNGSHTLQDSELGQCATELRAKYSEKAEQWVTSSVHELESLKGDIKEAMHQAELLCIHYEQKAAAINGVEAGPSGSEVITPPVNGGVARSKGVDISEWLHEAGEQMDLVGQSSDNHQPSHENIDALLVSGRGHMQSTETSAERHQEDSSSSLSVSVQEEAAAVCDSVITKSKYRSKFRKHIWWLLLIEWVQERGKTNDLVNTVKDDLVDHPDRPAMILNFRDIAGLQYVLYNLLEKLEENRNIAHTSLEQLVPSPHAALLAAANECHLRPNMPKGAKKCQLCIADGHVIQYERLLFAGYQGGEGVDIRSGGGGGDGGRAPGLFERLLKSLLHFARVKHVPEGLIEAAKGYLDVFDRLKKEYEVMRTLSMALDKRVCVHDELRMAASRYRVASELESAVWGSDPLVVNLPEVPYRTATLLAELDAAKISLKRSLGQSMYLQGLSQRSEDTHHSTKEEVCPVCMSGFGDKWAVFPCGHPVCVECVVEMVKVRGHHSLLEPPNVKVVCPLCRLSTTSESISYVQQHEEVCLSGENIKGEWSTKVTAVVGVLLDIQAQDKGAKALVFSSWCEVLEIISQALKANGIHFTLVESKQNFQTNLALFKKSPDVNVLLMPIYAGSKGLNIVEATHVLLVEPMLNTGAELQAIGRVHRMGQTKPTTVHRFYIKNTVEERICHLFSNNLDQAKCTLSNESETSLSLAEIQGLFLM